MMSSSQNNLDNFDPSRFNRNLEETERELQVYFQNILECLYKTPNFDYPKFRQSLGNIRSYRNPDVELHEEINFEDYYYRCAYIFAYSLIHSVIAYDQFSNMMLENPTMMKRIVSMKDIRLCTFGGGPAFEIVAICKLLCRILAELGSDERDPLRVHVTIIDICAEWQTEAKCIISSIQNKLQTSNYLTVDFSFLEADLTKDFLPNVINAFKKAHFVTMLKFVSDVYRDYGEKKLFHMVNKIIESMSFKSCLFILDFSGGGVFNKTYKMIDKLPRMPKIYGPSLYYCSKLHEDTVEKFPGEMKSFFRRAKCTPQSTISCSAWMKIRTSPKVANLEYLSPPVDAKMTAAVHEDLEKCKEKQPKIKKVKVKKLLQSRQNLKALT